MKQFVSIGETEGIEKRDIVWKTEIILEVKSESGIDSLGGH